MRRAAAGFLILATAALGLPLGRAERRAPSAPGQAGGNAAPATPLPRANQVITPRAYISLAPVPRGRTFEAAVIAAIRLGFHINAHRPTLDYLIPTVLDAELPPGFRALATVYPAGVLRKFKFSPQELSVYEGSVALRLKLQAPSDAPLGPTKLALVLRYQACNDEACLPPVKLPVAVEFQIAEAGAAAKPVHPEIFAARTKASPRASH